VCNRIVFVFRKGQSPESGKVVAVACEGNPCRQARKYAVCSSFLFLFCKKAKEEKKRLLKEKKNIGKYI